MKNPLNYQSSEYDCGPVCLINGIRYLFDREDVFPEVLKFINLYCMDTYNDAGEICKKGTSAAAMDYISCWLNHFSQVKGFPICCEHITAEEVTITDESKITKALQKGGVVVLRLYLEVSHYVLLTGIEEDRILLFDPYYEEESDPDFDEEYKTEEIRFIHDMPKKANRSVSADRMNRTSCDYYEMGDFACREALIMFNKNTCK
ncbi:MAG: peptidase C39 [Lachnospiraceae bacterium]|nr:peptidase C39 [Lachnospiraceae bacterium]